MVLLVVADGPLTGSPVHAHNYNAYMSTMSQSPLLYKVHNNTTMT